MSKHWITLSAVALAAVITFACAKAEDKPAEKPKAEAAERPGGVKRVEEDPAGIKKAEEKPAAPVENLKEKASYAIGMNIAENLLGQGFDAKELDVDIAIVADGFKDALNKAKPRYNEEEIKAALDAFSKGMEAKREARMAKLKDDAANAKKAGETFLAENGKKEGVKATKSGLQYQVVKAGDGPKPKATDTVKVHYKGTLLNGEEFDSSYKRNEPAVFPLDGVIPGWTEGLQLMPVGSKYKLFVPSDLAYGERGRPSIPPNSVLVFEVELLSIEKE